MPASKAFIHQHLDQILDLLNDGICITDAEGIILYLNRRYEEISSLSREVMVGRNAQDFVCQGMLNIIVNPEVVQTRSMVTRVQNTSTGRRLLLEGHPIFDDLGKVIMCITFVRDESSMANLQASLLRQKEIIETFSKIGLGAKAIDNCQLEVVQSAVMQDLYRRISRIAPSDVPVLILGETGTGKDVIARRIHYLSERSKGPFIKIDCGSMVPSLIEAELFGYEGGSFTGAQRKGKMGLIEAASRGTLFLDEVGELPLSMQVKLLRVLQDGEIVRVGSITAKKTDVRILAATNKNLEQAVTKGEFRRDLYFRLKFIEIKLPPLRERVTEIVPMAHAFLNYYSRKYSREMSFTKEADKALTSYSWPGNVRELRNMVHGLSVSIEGGIIDAYDLPFVIKGTKKKKERLMIANSVRSYRESMEDFECRFLDEVLSGCNSVNEAADKLGMDRSTLFRKIKSWKKRGVVLGEMKLHS